MATFLIILLGTIGVLLLVLYFSEEAAKRNAKKEEPPLPKGLPKRVYKTKPTGYSRGNDDRKFFEDNSDTKDLPK